MQKRVARAVERACNELKRVCDFGMFEFVYGTHVVAKLFD